MSARPPDMRPPRSWGGHRWMAVRCSSFTSGRCLSLHQRTCSPCRRRGGWARSRKPLISMGRNETSDRDRITDPTGRCSLADEKSRQWLVQIKRDEESGPAFYKVEVRDAEADPDLSKSRQATDLDSLRTMMSSFRGAEISSRAMFGA